jgi:hypothetical protein
VSPCSPLLSHCVSGLAETLSGNPPQGVYGPGRKSVDSGVPPLSLHWYVPVSPWSMGPRAHTPLFESV